jgi:hypothetical protein
MMCLDARVYCYGVLEHSAAGRAKYLSQVGLVACAFAGCDVVEVVVGCRTSAECMFC